MQETALFFLSLSFIMCLTANNVQWITPPVWRSCDNSDENTANRLPPTMQFKAHGSGVSAQVGECPLAVTDPPSALTDRVFACRGALK